MIMNFNDFLQWERGTRDTIDLKKTYIDIADDLAGGVLLSQIIYYYLPDRNGKDSKLRVVKNDKLWIAKRREDWWNECRIKPKQVDRILKELKRKGLIETKVFKFAGTPTTHIRLIEETFMKKLNTLMRENESSSKGNNLDIPEMGTSTLLDEEHPLTKTTGKDNETQTTTNNNKGADAPPTDNRKKSKVKFDYTSLKEYQALSEEEQHLYDEYIAFRKSKHLPNTELVHNRLLAKYTEYGGVKEIIENAIVNGWRDFYPIRREYGNGKFGYKSAGEVKREKASSEYDYEGFIGFDDGSYIETDGTRYTPDGIPESEAEDRHWESFKYKRRKTTFTR